jgi:DNA-binding transcriptional LysR family regulator
MMNYRLDVFRKVAELRSITRASHALRLSQSAVTKHVKLLEEELRVSLFVRTPVGMDPTDAGIILLGHVQQIAKAHERMAQRLLAPTRILTGTLRIGSSRTVLGYFLPALISAFKKAHPTVNCDLFEGNSDTVIGVLLDQRIDLGVIEGPCHRPEIQVRPFYQDEIIWIAAPDHPLAGKRVTAWDILKSPVICREIGAGDRILMEAALRQRGFGRKRLSIIQEGYSAEIVKGFVRAGLGIAYISALAARRDIASGELIRLICPKLDVPRVFSLILPRGPEPAGVEGAFISFLMEKSGRLV